MTPQKLTFLLLFTLLSVTLSAGQVTIVAKSGDGVYSVLRHYGLLEFPCNLQEFYRLNRLRSDAHLLIGRTYKLPIEELTYNGKSIRTTTNNKNYNRALDIQHYNEDLLEKGVRSTDFRKDKTLYVPYHIDHCPTPPQVESTTTVPSASGPTPEPDLDKEIKDIGEITKAENPKNLAPATAPSTNGRPTGPAPEQTTTSARRTFDIFGEKYAYVPKIDNQLAGRIFYVVAGHGGPDPGATARRGNHRLYEDEYAYDVALRLTRNILAHGGTPYMIVRDQKDGIRDERYLKADKTETVWGGDKLPLNQKRRLWQRCDIINSLYEQNIAKGLTDQTMISIHIDSRSKSRRVDLFFYHHENDPAGEVLARKMRDKIKDMYAETRAGRGYRGTVGARDLHVLRETKPTGVFIELANMANSSDQIRIIEPANRQLMADWLLLGLL
ncbi:N-acetylmuramoyl-L-alanine amidase family protein [Neolewinella antarctica]|uniref:N-acetylmuramoyl-L-alanine amidase n=1 Tax=Neolewinella antarctica TaxID=442734 RepID=A0ABX0XHR3_9BACT|nr:N-acetylmuramoyl-L-alanine amidase [Neolewinella antarctica]NJC28293.1 N-acetylmuramoyl-L-alanine amidase [Neolewinella antarctica]